MMKLPLFMDAKPFLPYFRVRDPRSSFTCDPCEVSPPDDPAHMFHGFGSLVLQHVHVWHCLFSVCMDQYQAVLDDGSSLDHATNRTLELRTTNTSDTSSCRW